MAPTSNPGTTGESPAQAPHPLQISPPANSNQQMKSSAGPSTSSVQVQGQSSTAGAAAKKRKHRAGKKKRNRRQSFATRSEATDASEMADDRPSLLNAPSTQSAPRPAFYRLGQNHSNTSLDSDVLMDHRDHGDLQTRRPSMQPGMLNGRSNQVPQPSNHRSSFRNPFSKSGDNLSRPPRSRENGAAGSDEEDVDDHTPLLSSSQKSKPALPRENSGHAFARYGVFNGQAAGSRHGSRPRRTSTNSPTRSTRRNIWNDQTPGAALSGDSNYDVNNPPSRPTTPPAGSMGYDDVMLTSDLTHDRAPRSPGASHSEGQDTIIDIDAGGRGTTQSDAAISGGNLADQRRHTVAHPAEADVCFPTESLSEIGEDDFRQQRAGSPKQHRRRRSYWPDLSVLEEWAHEEKEERSQEGVSAKRLREDVMIGGRLRPKKTAWHRDYSDAPWRWTYFNEEFDSTIHSQTISGLVQPGQTFQTLFIPDPPELGDSSSEDDEDESHHQDSRRRTPTDTRSVASTRQASVIGDFKPDKQSSGEATAQATPSRRSPIPRDRPKRFGSRPIFWLDVLCPTEAEMRVLAKTFGIHPLTVEDILMEEPREKVELFKNYYFVNYRTFEQDENSSDYLDALNMYAVVFREGVITFHFSMIPHPANVRRRIRQLTDYLILSSDWISYAIIDDITDVYAPLIQRIEDEVDGIDDEILQLHSTEESSDEKSKNKNKTETEYEKPNDVGNQTFGESGSHMLRRVGECRKKVMSLYRLLGNKADVIKGFAKRCNEQWDVAPRTEIGLYLGDIQDHIITMTGNLSHYENLLSRAHSNYLAQINMRMNERQEHTADVLGKLTVLGTIVLPMNIITGMWGMNVLVPGQDIENLNWFFGITTGLIIFGVTSYLVAKRVYGIV